MERLVQEDCEVVMSNASEVKSEFRSPSFRNHLRDKLGVSCMYCGTTKDVEYHHIVPISQGGDNRIQNIVPLCRVCHAKAHKKRQQNYEYTLGRKRIPLPDNWETIVRLYASGEITHAQARQMSGLKRNKFYLEFYEAVDKWGLKDNRSHKIK